jgi:hypothetical protein
VWIQLEVAHDLRERVPLDLRKREKNMFIGQQRVIAAPGFLHGSIDYSLR